MIFEGSSPSLRGARSATKQSRRHLFASPRLLRFARNDSNPLRRLEFLVGKRRGLRRLDDDEAVVQRGVAGIAPAGQILIGLGELLGVLGLYGLVEARHRLPRLRLSHLGDGKVTPLGWHLPYRS